MFSLLVKTTVVYVAIRVAARPATDELRVS